MMCLKTLGRLGIISFESLYRLKAAIKTVQGGGDAEVGWGTLTTLVMQRKGYQ
jgi:hypothetical protein